MSRKSGKAFEELAENHLLAKGYELVTRNWQAGRYGEIDLIFRQGQVVVFVEVKGRAGSTHAFQSGVEALNNIKQKRLARSISRYLADHPHLEKFRFDLVVVEGGPNPIISHLENLELPDFSEV